MRGVVTASKAWRGWVAGVAWLAAAACADAVGPATPEGRMSVERIGAGPLEGAPGFPLADSVRVRVVGEDGVPVAGTAVSFRVVGGGGSVSPAEVVSGGDGTAAARWVLGPAEGENRLQVGVGGEAADGVEVVASARYGRAAAITRVSGASATMPIGCPLAEPFTVRVTDASGAPVAGTPVLFQPEGGDAADGEVTTTDGDGVASVRWTVGAADEVVVARIAAAGDPRVVFEATGIPVAPNGYSTVGNRIIGPDCAPFRFLGVARPGLQWWPDDERLSDPEASRAEFEAMRSWGANVVRLPLYQRYWLQDLTFEGVTYRKDDYRALIAGLVERANAAGLAVILDLHTSDRGDPDFPDEVADIQQMADVAHSIPFWRDVAAAYRENGRVVFQLYTEPNQIDWEVWRNGGMVPAGDTYPPQSSGIAFEAAGMQDLYDAVREVGAENLVIVNGQHWGYDLSGIPQYALDGHNIVYATHPYDYSDKQPEAWWDDWGFLSETHPVMIAEFGDYVCNANGYYTKVLDFADEHHLSWLAWAWWVPPADRPEMICEFPALLEGWPGTPSPTGQIVQARLRSYSN